MDENEDHRAKMERLRRWEADQRRAQETQALQRQAAQRKRAQVMRKVWVSRLGGVLAAMGGVVALVHVVRHLGGSPRGLEDLAVGYPTAGGLILLGLVMLGVR